jgi:sulfur relay (sulfurtransferase) DsrC/TusE family protein
MESVFIELCKRGYMKDIRKWTNQCNINIHWCDEYGFRLACEQGYLNIVEYLTNFYETSNTIIDIHINEEEGFRTACSNGHYNIIKYLVNLYKNHSFYTKININARNEEGFKMACRNNHLNIIKYLMKLYMHSDYEKITINGENNFRSTISTYSRVAKFLLSAGSNYYNYKQYKIIIL